MLQKTTTICGVWPPTLRDQEFILAFLDLFRGNSKKIKTGQDLATKLAPGELTGGNIYVRMPR